MKSLVNQYIEHTKFGRGLVINEEAGKITIEFTEQIGNKKFQFPDAVEYFLKFEDSSLQEESLLMLESKKQKLAEETEQKRLEQIRLKEEQLLEELEQKKKYKRPSKSKASNVVKKTVKKLVQPDGLEE